MRIVAAWAPALDNLRAAATSGHPVTVYWDDSSNTVTTLIVRWNQHRRHGGRSPPVDIHRLPSVATTAPGASTCS